MPEGESISRLESSGGIKQPEVKADYLVEPFLQLIKLTSELKPSDIYYWCKMSGTEFSTWEFKTITSMISSFNHQKSISIKKDCPSPLLSKRELQLTELEARRKQLLE